MQQLLAGVAFLHDNWVLHRDLKTSNILYSNRGELKARGFPGTGRLALGNDSVVVNAGAGLGRGLGGVPR